jgi:DNA transposition AAA+ family ATPase
MINQAHPEKEAREAGDVKTYPCDEKLRKEILDLRGSNAWTNTSLAAQIGYTDAVVSQYLGVGGNRYSGNVKRVEKKFMEFLRDQRLSLDASVASIACDVSRQVEEAIEDIRTSKQIGAVLGEPGIGKSRGIHLYCANHELAIPLFVWYGERNASSTEECLFKSADVARVKRGGREAKMLAEKMAGSNRIIIVDDAHKLTCPALQLLYDFRDRTGLPIALFGDHRLIEKLRNDPQRLSRTGSVYTLKLKVTEDLIEHHIRQIIPDVNGELPALKKLCNTIAREAGHFRSVQMELARAVRLKKGCPDWSWCAAVRAAHTRLIRDYELAA